MAEETTQEPLEMGSGFTFSEPGADVESQEATTNSGFTMDLGKVEDVIVPEIVAPIVEGVKKPVTEVVNEEVVAPIVEEEYEAVELDEDLALQYLADSKGMTVDEFKESLTPKEQRKYAPEIEKFQEFVEKTGNHSYKDFEATQKDWTQEPSEVVLKELMKIENPLLSKKEIDFLYDKKYSFDEDIDDDDVVMERQINTKVDLQKAHNYLDKQKEDFMVKGGSDDYIPEEYRNAKADWEDLLQQQESTEIARQSNYADYVAKTESVFSKDFDGFKIKLGNDTIGFEDVSIKPDNLQEIKSYQTDIANFNKEFFDEKTGKLEKPKEWHTALYMAKHYEAELNKAYNRGIAKQLEIDDKLSKNIQPDNIQSQNAPIASGYTFFVE
jgi:hypothetical protein